MTPYERLGRLDPDTRDHLAALALAAMGDREPFERLTPSQSRVVWSVFAHAPRHLTWGFLCEATSADTLDPKSKGQIKSEISQIRRLRPDIGMRIETLWGIGCRWVGPAPERQAPSDGVPARLTASERRAVRALVAASPNPLCAHTLAEAAGVCTTTAIAMVPTLRRMFPAARAHLLGTEAGGYRWIGAAPEWLEAAT